ncbi:unnamed protein product [Paramecium pentaurelia]|uniref:WD40-repeat-containing domain n=1 Tax=Paramecium pentaurelia TaxID=43138 RepID=A0A8S1XAC4_9CILI|nr:unnamed protein product [Paramecium pentaurelia]
MEQQQNERVNSNYFQLNLKNLVKVEQICQGMDINKEGSLLLLDYLFVIAVFVFKNGLINKLQLLLQPQSIISNVLLFLNKKSYFISTSFNSLILWSTNLIGSQKYIKKLEGSDDQILSIAFHPTDENIIFSGSSNKKINIWSISATKNPCQQTLNVPLRQIIQLQILQDGNKLVALGNIKQMIVMENKNNLWKVKQLIELKQQINQIQILSNNILMVSQNKSGLISDFAQNLQIFSFKDDTTLFSYPETLLINDCVQLIKQVEFQNNKNKQFLLVICASNLYIIKFQNIDQGKMVVEQILNYQDLMSTSNLNIQIMSSDGKYLIISDISSSQIHILELKQNY